MLILSDVEQRCWGEVSVFRIVCLQDCLVRCRQVLTLARLAEICFGKGRMTHTWERLIRPHSAAISSL